MPFDIQDKKGRAKLAVDYYIKRENPAMLRPDGEDDRKLDLIIDRLAENIVTLAVRISESAAWMRWSAECPPPAWAVPFLTPAEIEGKGPPCPPQEEEEGPRPAKGRRKGKVRITKAMTDPSSPEFIGMRPEYIQFLIDHFDETPAIDPRTGKPPGLIR